MARRQFWVTALCSLSGHNKALQTHPKAPSVWWSKCAKQSPHCKALPCVALHAKSKTIFFFPQWTSPRPVPQQLT